MTASEIPTRVGGEPNPAKETDPLPNPEPSVPSLPEADPGIFQPKAPQPVSSSSGRESK